MSSYLFVMSEGGGNVPPELAIARRLVARGHSVRVIADPTLANGARAAGCGFVAYGPRPGGQRGARRVPRRRQAHESERNGR
jgi:UDP:flavonoid glycosyltransferase YjiC (YdhE family)